MDSLVFSSAVNRFFMDLRFGLEMARTQILSDSSCFSILSVFTGLELVSTFMFVWEGYANAYWGLPFAIFSTLSFFGIFLVRYLIARKGKRVHEI